MFSSAKLNYDFHNKELLEIFEGFKCWWHYLEGSALPIDVVTNNKNLEYFSTIRRIPPWSASRPPAPMRQLSLWQANPRAFSEG
jgi:RNase H-like domain found in reverse transcriptase